MVDFSTRPGLRAVLDACVIYPTVMREMLLGVGAAGAFVPLWSERILEEWARAAAKSGAAEEAIARGEIALCRARWPDALIAPNRKLEDQLFLPDRADRHVLATAITGKAGIVVTMNLRDFPRRTLAEHGVLAVHPDAFLAAQALADPVAVATVAERVQDMVQDLSGQPWPLRKLMKKARMPRLGKALERLAGGRACRV